LRTGLFSVELLVENFFKLDHLGGVVWEVMRGRSWIGGVVEGDLDFDHL
jgi:hypothetical protein